MSEEPRDAELVRAFQHGDASAFEALVVRYVRLAGAAAYQVVRDYERAADVVQDAFLKMHRTLPGLREPERFRTWLYGVVRTVALDHLRRVRRGPGSLGDMAEHEEPAAPEDDPTLGAEGLERREHVMDALAALPAGYREVIVLKYMDERSYKDIAQLLGTTVEAVEARLHRARASLRSKLRAFARKSGLTDNG